MPACVAGAGLFGGRARERDGRKGEEACHLLHQRDSRAVQINQHLTRMLDLCLIFSEFLTCFVDSPPWHLSLRFNKQFYLVIVIYWYFFTSGT